MRIRNLLFLLSLFIVSGCNLLDYIRISETETTGIPLVNEGTAPPNLQLVSPNQDIVTFDLGSYCWTGTDTGICADAMPPEYTEDQHIAVDASLPLELDFADPFPTTASLSLYPGSNLFAQEAILLEATLDDSGYVSATIPENLEGQYVLAVFATWNGGDAFYTLPINIER
jgi:hypothetical protein